MKKQIDETIATIESLEYKLMDAQKENNKLSRGTSLEGKSQILNFDLGCGLLQSLEQLALIILSKDRSLNFAVNPAQTMKEIFGENFITIFEEYEKTIDSLKRQISSYQNIYPNGIKKLLWLISDFGFKFEKKMEKNKNDKDIVKIITLISELKSNMNVCLESETEKMKRDDNDSPHFSTQITNSPSKISLLNINPQLVIE